MVILDFGLVETLSFNFILTNLLSIQNLKFKWRKGWDSNPRNPFEVHYISNVANSTALAPFQNIITNYEMRNSDQSKVQNQTGGEGGIRTHGTR